MSGGEVLIRQMNSTQWKAVKQIYKEGIATGMATFETKVPTWSDWNKTHLKKARLVALKDEELLGWAALSAVSSRCVYGGVAEISVYVATMARGLGIGEMLMRKLIEISEKEGYWSLQSGIFPENKASIQLHLKVGFRTIGYREKIGQLNGEWKDNILMERRSKKIGII